MASVNGVTFTNGTTFTTTMTTSITITDQIWNGWVNATTSTGTLQFDVQYAGQMIWNGWQVDARNEEQRRLDAEQAARERESRMRLHREQIKVAAAKMEAAEARAMELLEMVLSADEWQEYQTLGQVTVEAPSGRRYLVVMTNTVHGNIVEIDEHGCRLGNGCVAPQMYDENGALPLADGWIGQILGLRNHEELYRSTANWSNRRSCLVTPPVEPALAA